LIAEGFSGLAEDEVGRAIGGPEKGRELGVKRRELEEELFVGRKRVQGWWAGCAGWSRKIKDNAEAQRFAEG
jgi:hypothetical protein